MVNIAVVSTLIILSVAIIVLNSGCFFILLSSKKQRRASSLLLASLLIIHIIQGIIVIPFYTVKRWKIEDKAAKVAVCDAFRFSYLLTNYLSCITILLISLDRFVAIRFPLQYRVRAVNSCAVKVMAGSWVYVLILCLIPFRNDSTKCNYNPSRIWSVSMLSCNTFIPFLIIIFIYTYISRKSFVFVRNCERRRCRQRGEKPLQRKQKSNKSLRTFLSKEFGAAKVAILITASYIICWGPSFMYYMLKNICKHCFSKSFKDSLTEENLNYAMKFLTLVDGLAAPIIYCLRNMEVFKKRRRSSSSFTQDISRRLTTQKTSVALDSTSSQIDKEISWSKEGTKENHALSPIPDTDDFRDDIGMLGEGHACDATEDMQMMLSSEEDDSQKMNLMRVSLNGRLSASQVRALENRDANETEERSSHDGTYGKPGYNSLNELEMHTNHVVGESMISRWDSTQNEAQDSGDFTVSSKSMGNQTEMEPLPDDSRPLLNTSEESSSSKKSNDSKKETVFIE